MIELFHHFMKCIALLLILCMGVACTSVRALHVHSAAQPSASTFIGEDKYIIEFNDGSKIKTRGRSLEIREDGLYVYSPDDQSWNHYALSEVKEVYHRKFSTGKTVALSVGMGFLAILAAATTAMLVTPH